MALNNVVRGAIRTTIGRNSTNLMIQCPSHRVVYYATQPSNDIKRKKKIPERIGVFLFGKYTNYINDFQSILSKRFPKTMTVYRGFMDGISLFGQDVKEYVKILAKVNSASRSMYELTRHEIELYNQVPKEMLKLAPVLIGSALPLGYAVMMPLAYWFPKALMTTHFWTATQREQFGSEMMASRVREGPYIIKMITASNVCQQRSLSDEQLWSVIVQQLRRQQLILPHKLIACIDMFKGEPFHLDKLPRRHIRHLAKLHGIKTFWFPRKKLKQLATLILAMDRAIVREGGIRQLPLEDMRQVCRLRGLHANQMERAEMMQWLNQWMHISVSADETSLSLLLHASAILGHNAPANQQLLKLMGGGALHKLQLSGRAALKSATN